MNDIKTDKDYCLEAAENLFLAQGLLELKEKNIISAEEFIQQSLNSDICEHLPLNETVKKNTHNTIKNELFFIKSVAVCIIQKDEMIKYNSYNLIYNFISDFTSKEEWDIEKHNYQLDNNENEKYRNIKLRPFYYLYCKMVKIICLKDIDSNSIYVVGVLPNRPVDLSLFFRQMLPKYDISNFLSHNPLLLSFEIAPEDAAILLGYSNFKMKEILDNKKIFSTNYSNAYRNVPDPFNQLLFEKDKRRIPLIELHTYIKNADISKKEERLELLVDYIDTTSKALVGNLRDSEIPSPLRSDVRVLSLLSENKKLKRKKTTPKERDYYISIVIPEIVNLIKKVEVDGEQGNVTWPEFIKIIRNKNKDYPREGEIIGKNIFKALPGKYRETNPGRKSKSKVKWSTATD